jgi:GAF domain-containing protein
MNAHGALIDTVQRLIAAGLGPDELLAQSVAAIGEALDFADVAVFWLDPVEPGGLVLLASKHRGETGALGPPPKVKTTGVLGDALRSAAQVLAPAVPVKAHPEGVAELATPIRVGGQVVGLLDVESRHPISTDEAAAVATVATLLGFALEARS